MVIDELNGMGFHAVKMMTMQDGEKKLQESNKEFYIHVGDSIFGPVLMVSIHMDKIDSVGIESLDGISMIQLKNIIEVLKGE